MDDTITIETDMFEQREVKSHFINPCCFGEDLAAWLKRELLPLADDAFTFSQSIQEDYGWGFGACHGKTVSGWPCLMLVRGRKNLLRNG